VGIEEFYVTFGVQYTGDEETGEVHPFGMTGKDYAVIEAPHLEMARNIAFAIFGQQYSFIYDWDNFMGDGTYERWYAGKDAALIIKWIQEKQ
jgi:hypothetical protein